MAQELPSVPDHSLIRPIGRGAFGEVWLAHNVLLRYRAVKVVQRDKLDSSHHFTREFNGIQRFEPLSRNHEGLIDILQVGRAADDTYFYYIMELGDDLEPRQDFSLEKYEPRTLSSECAAHGRMPAPDAALIGAQLAQALGYLHSHGLTHCDVKPSNVLFVRGVPKIGDPGLVSMIDASQSMRGTPGYLAPEGPGTPRADIYSLGKLLYVISTGRQPGQHPGLPPEITKDAHGDDFRRLNSVVVKACAHNPAERYATAEALRADLLEVHAGRSPVEMRRRLRLALRTGIALAVLVLIVLVLFERARRQAEEREARLAQNYSEFGARLDDGNNSLVGLAYFAEALHTQRDAALADATARRISWTWRYSPRLVAQWRSPHTINRLAFSPTDRQLALASSHGEVWLWDCSAKPPERLGQHTGEVTSIAFTRDGKWLISGGEDRVVRYWNRRDPSGHHATQLDQPIASLALHPKEPRLAVGSLTGSAYILALDGTNQTVIPASDKSLRCIAFSPDGAQCLAGSENGWVYELSATGAVQVVQLPSWVYDIAFSGDGKARAAASGNRAHLHRLDNPSVPRLRHPTLVRSVAFSPADPDRLLTACFDQTVRLWSCEEDLEIMPPIPTEAGPQHAIFDATGETFAVCTFSGLVRVYSLVPPFAGGRGVMAVSADGSRSAHIGTSGANSLSKLTVNDTLSNRVVGVFDVTSDEVDALLVNRDGSKLLLGQVRGEDTYYELFDLGLQQVVGATTVLGSASKPKSIHADLDPSGTVVSLGLSNGLLLWRPPAQPVQLCPWTVGSGWETEVAFSSASDRLAVVWSSNVLVATLAGQVVNRWSLPVSASTVDIDPGGGRVVIGEDPPAFAPSESYLWDVANAKRDGLAMRMEDGCFLARFAPTGTGLLLADQRKNTVFYTRNSGQWRREPQTKRHPGIVLDASFSPDGRWYATHSGDRSGDVPGVRVWDQAGQPVTSTLNTGGRGRVFMMGKEAVLFSSRRGRNPHWRRWDLTILSGTSKELVDLAHLLSCQRVSPSAETSQLEATELNELWQRLSAVHPEWFSHSLEAR